MLEEKKKLGRRMTPRPKLEHTQRHSKKQRERVMRSNEMLIAYKVFMLF